MFREWLRNRDGIEVYDKFLRRYGFSFYEKLTYRAKCGYLRDG